MGRLLFITLFAISAFPNATKARTWHIKPDGTGDAPTIQSGIDSCANHDTVLVGAGTYNENLHTRGKVLVLRSESGPQATIIDGGGRARVVTFDGGGVLAGFTIRNGWDPDWGGGLLVSARSNTIASGNTIEDNRVGSYDRGNGGGVCNGGGLLIANIIRRNSAGHIGGGLYNDGEARLNVITENACKNGGGGVYNLGVLKNNLISENRVVYWGGGIYTVSSSSVINNTVVGNVVTNGTAAGIGSESIHGYVPTIAYNIVVRNVDWAGRDASGIECLSPAGAPILDCNDVWANGIDSTTQVRCSPQDDRTFSADPLFCNEAAGDYGIDMERSPCAFPPPVGCVGFVGAYAPACRTTAVRSLNWTGVKRLYR